MSNHYTIQPTPTGRWAVVHPVPGTPTLAAICDCPTAQAAQALADEHNAERQRERELMARLDQHFAPSRWRHTQRGARAQHRDAWAAARHLPESPL